MLMTRSILSLSSKRLDVETVQESPSQQGSLTGDRFYWEMCEEGAGGGGWGERKSQSENETETRARAEATIVRTEKPRQQKEERKVR